jgi:hypothetical protein
MTNLTARRPSRSDAEAKELATKQLAKLATRANDLAIGASRTVLESAGDVDQLRKAAI